MERFLETENARGYPLIEFDNFRKVAQCRKKPKGGPFGLASTFGSIKNLLFSARIEPTTSCFSEN